MLSLIAVMAHTRLIAPSLTGPDSFAAGWSDRFPFTVEALTDGDNRSVLMNSFGAVFLGLAVVSIAYCLIRRRHMRQLLLVALWALPPVFFWGLRLGNSERHMIQPACRRNS